MLKLAVPLESCLSQPDQLNSRSVVCVPQYISSLHQRSAVDTVQLIQQCQENGFTGGHRTGKPGSRDSQH